MKPILFNDLMVQAILEDRKTQTRRLIKPYPTNPRWSNVGFLGFDDGHGREMKPRYKPGDILYVRETWARGGFRSDGKDWRYYYRADGDAPLGIKWRPSIHMPKEAARIFLRVTDLSVQRLLSITVDEIEREGIPRTSILAKETVDILMLADFRDLWNATVKKDEIDLYGFYANPWVWAYQFERISKAEAKGGAKA